MKNLIELRSVKDCIAYAKSINPKKEPLSIEKLRTFPGCEHYNDEEAVAILRSIEQLTQIVFELMMAGEVAEEPPGKIIHLKPRQTIKTQITNTKAA